jgi:hypothetical protein
MRNRDVRHAKKVANPLKIQKGPGVNQEMIVIGDGEALVRCRVQLSLAGGVVAAVFPAYGWCESITDRNILECVLDFNLRRGSHKEEDHDIVAELLALNLLCARLN